MAVRVFCEDGEINMLIYIPLIRQLPAPQWLRYRAFIQGRFVSIYYRFEAPQLY